MEYQNEEPQNCLTGSSTFLVGSSPVNNEKGSAEKEIINLDQQLKELCEALVILNSKPNLIEVSHPLPHHSVNIPTEEEQGKTETTALLGEGPSSPPDGGWGWVVVASTFYINFMLAGLIRSYGVLLSAVAAEFPLASTALIAWIPGVMGTTSLVLSPLSSFLCERFGCRSVVFMGGILTGTGTAFCYFLFSLPFLILSGGLVAGVGFTLCITPCLLIVGQYFLQHRALANSLSSAGSAVGGLVMPHIMRASLDFLDLGLTFLLLGGLMFTISLASFLLRPVPNLKKPQQCIRQENYTKSRLTKFCRSVSLDLFLHPVFVVLAVSVVLMSAGSPHVLYFLPAYAEGAGLSKFSSSSLLSYAAFGDLSGRVVFGWASDKQFLPRRVEYTCSIALAAVVVLALPSIDNFLSLATFSILYGTATGSWQCLIPVLLADYHGTDKLGGAISLVRMLQGFTNLAVPPITGYLRDLHGHFLSSFYMMGAIMAASAIVALTLPLAETLHKRRNHRNHTGAT